jgi:4-pyridoxolactonase
MADTNVYLLDNGSIEIDISSLHWQHAAGERYRFPVYSVLIEHKEGLLLYDTGIDKRMADNDPTGAIQVSEQQTLQSQLRLIGYKPSDVSIVMNSHYHFDHVGGNKLCTCATVVCHKHEISHFRNPDPLTEGPGYLDSSFLPENLDYEQKYEVVTGDQLIAKGVTLFETPGHTAGHYSLMVESLNRKPMIFTGDACYTQRSMQENLIQALHVDAQQAYDSLAKLKSLAINNDADLFYSHDKDLYPMYSKAPSFYC